MLYMYPGVYGYLLESLGNPADYYQSKIIQLLLDNVENTSEWMQDHLHLACLCNDLNTVKGLVKCGANLMKKDKWGWTALFYACGDTAALHPVSGTLQFILPCFIVPVQPTSRSEMVRWILRQSAGAKTVNDKFVWDCTALHRAALHYDIDVLVSLLEHGADPTICTKGDRSALMISQGKGNTRAITLLQTYEAIWKLNEWRPWNHSEYPDIYRKSVVIVAILAKTK